MIKEDSVEKNETREELIEKSQGHAVEFIAEDEKSPRYFLTESM